MQKRDRALPLVASVYTSPNDHEGTSYILVLILFLTKPMLEFEMILNTLSVQTQDPVLLPGFGGGHRGLQV